MLLCDSPGDSSLLPGLIEVSSGLLQASSGLADGAICTKAVYATLHRFRKNLFEFLVDVEDCTPNDLLDYNPNSSHNHKKRNVSVYIWICVGACGRMYKTFYVYI